jgi:hypothetical protein
MSDSAGAAPDAGKVASEQQEQQEQAAQPAQQAQRTASATLVRASRATF